MKQIVMAMLMFGIASCSVERAPAPTAAQAEDGTTQSTSAELTTASISNPCGYFVCEPRAQCLASEGGIVRGTCAGGSWVCCDR
ncbi:MAG TPA: hypothetical protein VGC42_11185 [Kofleriaceae bacterium]